MAQADRNKDDFFDKQNTLEVDKRYLQGQLNVLDDIIGLVAFMDSFKVFEKQ